MNPGRDTSKLAVSDLGASGSLEGRGLTQEKKFVSVIVLGDWYVALSEVWRHVRAC